MTTPAPFAGAFTTPMLLSEARDHWDVIQAEPHVYVQPKLDGWRCMANTRTRKIYSRPGREITTLGHINSRLGDAHALAQPEWKDGELYAHGFTLPEIQSMIKKGDTRISFNGFDVVSDRGFGVRGCWLPNMRGEAVQGVHRYAAKPESIHRLYSKFLAQGYEGIVIRLDGHGYEHGRSMQVFRMKPVPVDLAEEG